MRNEPLGIATSRGGEGMNDQILYCPKRNQLWIFLKDVGFSGDWSWFAQGPLGHWYPKTTKAAKKLMRGMVVLESARWLDEYR